MRADVARLEAKAGRFFRKDGVRRREVVAFAAELQAFGPTVAIGGVLRDLHLLGAVGFRSDVDFVVEPEDLAAFDRFAERQGAKLNRFGGFGMRRGGCDVDVWPLQRTWARVAGHRRVDGTNDLLDVTFFDWDAMIYDLASGRIVAKAGTIEAIAAGILDIILPDNPNPAGNAVRALRYGVRYGADFGPALRDHVARQIREHGWDALVEAESAAFDTRFLHLVDQAETARCLDGDADRTPVSLMVQQLDLPFAPAGGTAPTAHRGRKEAPRPPRRRTRHRPIAGEIAFG